MAETAAIVHPPLGGQPTPAKHKSEQDAGRDERSDLVRASALLDDLQALLVRAQEDLVSTHPKIVNLRNFLAYLRSEVQVQKTSLL